MAGKIFMWIMAIIPIVLSIGGLIAIAYMGLGIASGSLDGNPAAKSFSYMAIMMLSCIIAGFLWASYKIFDYIRSH